MGKNVDSGFSIIEIMIAIFVIAMAATVITLFSKNSLLMRGDSKGSEQAILTAQDKISDLSARINPKDGNDEIIIDGQKYSRIWTIQSNSTPKMATVTVKYNVLGKGRKVSFSGALNE